VKEDVYWQIFCIVYQTANVKWYRRKLLSKNFFRLWVSFYITWKLEHNVFGTSSLVRFCIVLGIHISYLFISTKLMEIQQRVSCRLLFVTLIRGANQTTVCVAYPLRTKLAHTVTNASTIWSSFSVHLEPGRKWSFGNKCIRLSRLHGPEELQNSEFY
jgi:hypothetical protein